MNSILLYRNPVPLDRSLHSRVKLPSLQTGLDFAAETNSVILAGVEMVPASRDYPIVFIRAADGKIVPSAVLGIRDKENLFVDHGTWQAGRYIPAFVRRYPFVPAEVQGGSDAAICVDEVCLTSDAKEGEELFDASGEPSPMLQRAIALMQDYQAQLQLTQKFTKRLEELDLFKEEGVRVDVKGGPSFALEGWTMVDESKLLGLDKDVVHELFVAGYLGWIYAHLISQGNFALLPDRLSPRLRSDE